MIVARNGDVTGVAIKTVEGVPIRGEVTTRLSEAADYGEQP